MKNSELLLEFWKEENHFESVEGAIRTFQDIPIIVSENVPPDGYMFIHPEQAKLFIAQGGKWISHNLRDSK